MDSCKRDPTNLASRFIDASGSTCGSDFENHPFEFPTKRAKLAPNIQITNKVIVFDFVLNTIAILNCELHSRLNTFEKFWKFIRGTASVHCAYKNTLTNEYILHNFAKMTRKGSSRNNYVSVLNTRMDCKRRVFHGYQLLKIIINLCKYICNIPFSE